MLAYYNNRKQLADLDVDAEKNAIFNMVGFYTEWGYPEKAAQYKTLLSDAESARQDE